MAFLYDGTSVQNKRDSNMDSLLLKERMISGQNVMLAAVCDGVGSLEEGAFASSAAIRMIGDWFDNSDEVNNLGIQIKDYLWALNQSIIRRAQIGGIQTATTLSLLILDDQHYSICHVGDSRIYALYHNGSLIQLTRDQVSGGKLTGYLGRKEQISFLFREGNVIREGISAFLLCSDGLHKRMDHALLQSYLCELPKKTIHKTIDRVIQYVIDNGETDNITAAIVKVER